ncbi:NAD-dependent epimerase/dehydratase [Calocera viscosa TUFC12733]|uniref:NAD-dependent epimerase/dehydratase n=1 Tax=Calocera viscosa (strain TUFC12733) TaxID=1330018 RepID=A0A167QVI6_CALVF|nr:NAD-dependent epimerase/dehydratase [Calocera viscosa TUFC12733]
MPAASFTDKTALGEPQSRPARTQKRVLVTGGSGKLGKEVVIYLVEAGYIVVNVDKFPPGKGVSPPNVKYVYADLTDMGMVMETLAEIDGSYKGLDAVVHLAAIPAAGMSANSHLFGNNAMSTYNMLEASRKLGIKKVILASSETLIGLPFDPHQPASLPITEESERRPESSYSLSKLVGEVMADQFARWDPELSVFSLRFSNVISREDYVRFSTWQHDPFLRKWNAWGYIDARDGGQAVELCISSALKGHHEFLIANEETVMEATSAELCKAVFPNVKYTPVPGLGDHQTVLSIEKAKKLLGFKPKHKWTEQVAEAEKLVAAQK